MTTRTYLKDIRERAGLSQRELADMAGIPIRSLQDYEANKAEIPIYRALKLAQILSKLTQFDDLMVEDIWELEEEAS